MLLLRYMLCKVLINVFFVFENIHLLLSSIYLVLQSMDVNVDGAYNTVLYNITNCIFNMKFVLLEFSTKAIHIGIDINGNYYTM